MTESSAFHFVAAAVYLVPALLWGSMTTNSLWYLHNRRPRSRLFHLLPITTGIVTLYYALGVSWALIPVELHQRLSVRILIYAAADVAEVGSMAVIRHFLRFVPFRDDAPSGRWLTANYGVGALVAVVALLSRAASGAPAEHLWFTCRVVFYLYLLAMAALCVQQTANIARGSGWGPGGVVTVRRPDVVIAASVLTAAAIALLMLAVTGGVGQRSMWTVLLDAGIGVTIAMPIAVRMLGEVVRRFVVAVTMIAATGAAFGAYRLAASLAGDELRWLLDFATMCAVVFALVPLHEWLREAINHVVLRRSARRRAAIQTFLHTLSPEHGALECCRRTLAEITRVMDLRGAAVLLRDGEAVVDGTFALESLRQVWPRGAAADALPEHGFDTAAIRELPLPLKEALIEAKVGLGIFPIISPHGRWGHLFISTTLLDATFTEEDAQALEGFTTQLALVLDGTELLARTVSVERSLAHAEKLAAIGELAARIAHEIRNPVTAARSLAQQLCREPEAPFQAEHHLILEELERVERQVAALLQFTRRDEFHFEPVDLGELTRRTVEAFRLRLDTAGIGVELDLGNDIRARADREKIRQVLINLIENAMDALADAAESKRLAFAVGAVNGTGTLMVTDNGPGVPAEALPRLFEPFFSLKAKGTGLGLAIAKRTVEAHGGHIEAACVAGSGMTFQIDLPLAGGEGTDNR